MQGIYFITERHQFQEQFDHGSGSISLRFVQFDPLLSLLWLKIEFSHGSKIAIAIPDLIDAYLITKMKENLSSFSFSWWSPQLSRGFLYSLACGTLLPTSKPATVTRFLFHCFIFISAFAFYVLSWFHGTHSDNPENLFIFWLATLIPSASLIPLCHAMYHIQRFQGLG